MAMDRTIHDTPEKVLVYGLRRIIQEQIKMLDENDAKVSHTLQEIRKLEYELLVRDTRITIMSEKLAKKPGPRIGTPSPIKKSDDDLRDQVKRLRSSLTFHREKSAGRKRYIEAMREAGFGKGPLVRKERPRGNRVCSKCGEYREHYKNCAYCIECWKHYKPLKVAQVKYEKDRVRTNRNGERVRIPKTSGIRLQSETTSGLRLETEKPNDQDQMG